MEHFTATATVFHFTPTATTTATATATATATPTATATATATATPTATPTTTTLLIRGSLDNYPHIPAVFHLPNQHKQVILYSRLVESVSYHSGKVEVGRSWFHSETVK